MFSRDAVRLVRRYGKCERRTGGGRAGGQAGGRVGGGRAGGRGSAECLAGTRCDWCGVTVSARF